MTRSAGGDIPPPLAAMLDGQRVETKVGETFLLVTAGDDGWPHVAMLSVGELLADGRHRLRLALWPGSHTTANLERGGRALLFAVVPPAVYHLRLSCRRSGDVVSRGHRLAGFTADVEEVREDVVPYAEVDRGISFRLVDPEPTLAGWQEAIAGMREQE